MRTLVAGVTGQLGAGVVEAAASAGVELVPLIRPLAGRSGRARAERLFPDCPSLAEHTLEGDVRKPLWGLDQDKVKELAGNVDAVLNIAAETNWAAPHSRQISVNLMGAINGQRLASALNERHGRCSAYVYASSIHVAGELTGSIPELPLPPNAGRTAYEQSKWLAERALLDCGRAAAPPIGIARLGGLLGNSVSGQTSRRNSLYLLADRWDRLPGRLLPVTANGRVDMLPRDVAGKLLLRFVRSVVRMASPDVQLVHICAGESAPTTSALIAALQSIDCLRALPQPRTITVPARPLLLLSRHLDRFLELSAARQNMLTGLRYLTLDRTFERARLSRLVAEVLPTASLELIVRLAFDRAVDGPAEWDGATELARFRG